VILAYHFPKARIPVYGLAILAGISRVYFGVHYLSDVLAGFVLGFILGWLSILLERTIISITKGAALKKQDK
jgi:undecaprenyl-diphosphatase